MSKNQRIKNRTTTQELKAIIRNKDLVSCPKCGELKNHRIIIPATLQMVVENKPNVVYECELHLTNLYPMPL